MMTAAMAISGIGSIGGIVSNTNEQKETFYDILGVAENATAEEIKRAYFRLVRKIRPTDDPEAFQKFQTAGQVLNDPRRRREYDQIADAGRRVQVLSDQAVAAVEKDPQKAFSLLKAAVVLAPDAPRPRLLLAHVLTRLNDYVGAEKQYRRLISEFPNDETLHYRFGRCLFVQERYDETERELGLAIRLNPRYHDAHMFLARVYEKNGQYGPAIFALEKAIANDDVEDYADFDALLRLLVLHLRMENNAEAERTARRIVKILPEKGESEETRRTERAAMRMLARARELAGEGNFAAARALTALGSRLPNASPETVITFSTLAREIRLIAEAQHLQDDALVPDELKRMMEGVYLNTRLNEAERQARRREVADALHAALTVDARRIQSLMEYARREYPTLAQEEDNLFSELTTRAARRLEIPLENNTIPSTRVLQNIPASTEPMEELAPTETGNGHSRRRKGIMGWLKRK